MIERKVEVFMNEILFRNIISKFWTEEINQEVIVLLITCEMVLTNSKIWNAFTIAGHSGLVSKVAAQCKKSKQT